MADTTSGPPQHDPELGAAVPEEHAPYAPPPQESPPPESPPHPFDEAPVRSTPEPVTSSSAWLADLDRPVRPSPPSPASERRRLQGPLVLVAVLAGVIGAALSAIVVALLMSGDDSTSAVTVIDRVETQIVTTEGDPLPTATAVARRVLPSIVTVEVGFEGGGNFVSDGSGSGVVVDAERGLLVTNQHVIDAADQVQVVFADGSTYDATVVGADALTDLAVLSIDAVGLTAVELGAASDLEIGDTAIAVGSPLGLGGGPSVTVGVVSAFDRRVQTDGSELFGMLQTDAPITRGSSGGALVDDLGRLIGITTAIGVSDVGAEGLGFAIPIEMVTRIVGELEEAGFVRHAFLGITGTTFFEDRADGASVPAGVVVASVLDGSAADLAGLEAGDIIRSFDGEQVFTMEKLVVAIRLYRVDEVMVLEVDRDGAPLTLDVTLLERPEGV